MKKEIKLLKKIIKELKSRLQNLSKSIGGDDDSLILEIKVLNDILNYSLKKQLELEKFNNIFLLEKTDDVNETSIKNYLYNSMVYNFLTFAKDVNKVMDVINEHNTEINGDEIIKDCKENCNKFFSFKKALGKSGKIGIPYIFEVYGQDIIIKMSKNINLFSRNHADLERYQCFGYYIDNPKCVPQMKTMKVINGSSEYVNETIIGFLLNYIFFNSYFSSEKNFSFNGYPNKASDLSNSVFQIGYFQNEKDGVGYNVMEKCDNTLDKLFNNDDFSKIKFFIGRKFIGRKKITNRNDIMMMLLQQINNTLEILKKEYSFNHGDLKGGNFFYKIDDSYLNVDYPINGYEYYKNNKKGIFCSCNIRLKIADYGKSSMTYNSVRFYCNDTKFNLHKISQSFYNSGKSLSVTHDNKYLFNSKIPHGIELVMRHLACPYFLSADYYILITSLCLNSNIFYTFVKENKILDTIQLELNLENITGNPESITNTFKVLKGKYFTCSAIYDVSQLCIQHFTNMK